MHCSHMNLQAPNPVTPDMKSENSTLAKHYNSNTCKVGKHPDNYSRISTSNCFTYILLIAPWSLWPKLAFFAYSWHPNLFTKWTSLMLTKRGINKKVSLTIHITLLNAVIPETDLDVTAVKVAHGHGTCNPTKCSPSWVPFCQVKCNQNLSITFLMLHKTDKHGLQQLFYLGCDLQFIEQ